MDSQQPPPTWNDVHNSAVQYLLDECQDQLLEVLNSLEPELHYSVTMCFLTLCAGSPEFVAQMLFREPKQTLEEFDTAIRTAQDQVIAAASPEQQSRSKFQ